ncbi:MAG: hypothetical protein H6651_07705 [Ardenticatenales bacterium]|nr:hypothetical protein [Ardenticatenales bacterium]
MRTYGIVLLILVILFMVGAGAAAYFRRWPHKDVREQLTLIAHDRFGWTAQALIFPLVFGLTAILFLLITQTLAATGPRSLGLVAALLFGAACCLWLPISIGRIRYWSTAVALLAKHDVDRPVDINFGANTFWSHTICILLAIVLMSTALAWAGVLPWLGWLVALMTLAGLVADRWIWRDWPPFLNYLLLLILAIGLILA